ncbi:hypothetical protein [Bacteroidetes bacterium endosymbiont of Geopemphigus sp.]|uniref:hypothetical protein n=1 Tax=Bacteroidetes bacterium endosymbiont of Geopemphigus sp. TaxID=2047937 RepID=UPI0011AF2D9E|nr:hypothetical protein [Bacteroidetes bacterium endosymbiont of Geopemphigus sp.]
MDSFFLSYGISIAYLDMGFGSFRILIFHLMARPYSDAEVGNLMSCINALALPILGLSQLSISHTCFLPFLFALVMSFSLYR